MTSHCFSQQKLKTEPFLKIRQWNPMSKVYMKLKSIINIAFWHIALYCFVVIYVIAGGYAFHHWEGRYEDYLHAHQRAAVINIRENVLNRLAGCTKREEFDRELTYFLKNISSLNVTLDNYFIYNDPLQMVPKRWTIESSILFSFTILTTIGYGNVVPMTENCKIFTMAYGALGIPLFLITIADLGKFTKTAIMWCINQICPKALKKQGDRSIVREMGEVLLVTGMLLVFIVIGSALLPMWETQLSYFDSVYFSYMSLTTIGLGDIVPRRMDFLLPTLIYITVGLWLTTALVEQLVDVFRIVHYAGRKITQYKDLTVWLGNQKLTVGGLITTVCRRVGMSDAMINTVNWDRVVMQAMSGKAPTAIPVFPWHLSEFYDHDPPLIDLSIDLDQQEAQGSFYCSRPPRRRDSQLSAPTINWKRRLEEDLLEDI